MDWIGRNPCGRQVSKNRIGQNFTLTKSGLSSLDNQVDFLLITKMQLDERNTASLSILDTFPQQSLAVFTLPLQISCAVCSTATLLLLLASLCTSYWLTENPPQGLLHSGLWMICINYKCTLYAFDDVANFIHVVRGFLVAATFLSIISLACICLSFQRTHFGPMPMILTAAALSFAAGLFTLISMSVFTVSYRFSKPDIQQLTRYGSSFSLGWATSPMYFLTGFLIMLTEGTLDS